MGIVTSRFNLNSLHANGRRRSHQGEEQLYSYSLNKNYFSNYFFMGGERFEVNDPDYLFGDSCDLNFLTCSRPYSLPYKQAQQNLLTNLNTKQKAINKVSSRVSSLSSPLNILTGRHRQVSQTRKQDAQTQTANSNKGANGPEPSQPLVMLINIRKETLRLIKSSHACNLDSDQNSLTNTASISNTTSEQSGLQPSHSQQKDPQQISYANRQRQKRATKKAANPANRYSTTSSHATTVHPQDLGDGSGSGGGGGGGGRGGEEIEMAHTVYRSKDYNDSDTSSTTSNTYSSSQSTTASTSTGKSGYTSVRDVPPSECASDEGEFFEDALNEPSNLSTDNDSEKNQQKSLLLTNESTKETCDIKITIEGEDQVDRSSTCDIRRDQLTARDNGGANGGETSASAIKSSSAKILTKARSRKSPKTNGDKKPSAREPQSSNRVYNIEFTFDAEVDCSIRVSYFCTRVVSSNNVTYKPLHATYKSKTYTYKRGLNQKFEQQEHSFRPYLFDEDLLIYKPLDLDGNYNSGAVFPIVIHCVALEGPMPRQSQSLVATVEKSQLDDSYSIKPLKQMIFVDGVQYILQDIYGIENKPLTSSSSAAPRRTPRLSRQNLNSSCGSLYSLSNLRNSNMNLSETASINSVTEAGGGGGGLGNSGNRGSMVSNQYRSFGSENTFECVICMSEERDTMLLPCRHMCLCSSCAQSLRYQSSTCPICRCPFKAALNLRFTRRGGAGANRKRTSTAVDETEHKCLTSTITPTTTSASGATIVKSAACDNIGKLEQAPTRRESLTNSATPLLAASKPVDVRAKGSAKKRALDIPDAVVIPVEQLRSDRAGSGSVEVHNATGAAEDAEASEDAAGSGLKSMGVSASSPGAGGGACGGGGGGGGASNKSGKAKGGGTASSRISPGDDHRRASAAAARRAPEDGNK